ncbi:MAG: hypothetical protein AAGN46_01910 [Acidobacteriota bacterium]
MSESRVDLQKVPGTFWMEPSSSASMSDLDLYKVPGTSSGGSFFGLLYV